MTTRIQQSLHAILACPRQELGQLFYDKFLTNCPDAAPFFAGLDLKVQAKVLINSLQVVVACQFNQYPAAESYLVVLGNRHHRRNIPPSLYPQFREAMLLTLAQFHGDQWNDELEAEWRAALDRATEWMLSGYVVDHMTY
ncbi:MAG: globin domain-containing protein [Pirellulaceae bacterium]|nr:globin domain-containing protein [Pirellulaceae bacterium]